MNSSPVFICFLQVLCEAQGEASADPGRWSFWGRTKAHISGEFQKNPINFHDAILCYVLFVQGLPSSTYLNISQQCYHM